MATKIRLRRVGRKGQSFFRIVIADSKSPRDGRFVATIGNYNPRANPAVINVNAELHGWTLERARNKAGEIYDNILRVFDIAKEERIPSYKAADRLAEQRIAAIARVRQNFV